MQNICMIFVHKRRVQTYTASTHYEATNILWIFLLMGHEKKFAPKFQLKFRSANTF